MCLLCGSTLKSKQLMCTQNEFSEVKRENIIKYVKNLSLKRTRCRFYGKGLNSLDMITTNMLLPLKKN